MSDMVERVALSMCATDAGQEIMLSPDKWMALATSAVTAMREPTVDMVRAGEQFDRAVLVWSAMVDAALKDDSNAAIPS